MARLWVVEYQVVGHGTFPIDMLRYDSSYPASAEGILEPSHWAEPVPDVLKDRKVVLRHRDSFRGWSPTVDRWRSFGWSVVRESIKEHSF